MKTLIALLTLAVSLYSQTAQTTTLTVPASTKPTFTTNSGNTIFRCILVQNASPAAGTYTFRICQPTVGGTYNYTFAAFTGSAGMSSVPTGSGASIPHRGPAHLLYLRRWFGPVRR